MYPRNFLNALDDVRKTLKPRKLKLVYCGRLTRHAVLTRWHDRLRGAEDILKNRFPFAGIRLKPIGGGDNLVLGFQTFRSEIRSYVDGLNAT